MLQLKNISKQYKTGEFIQKALDDISLNFRDNEFVSILGPSGSGKTTLLNIVGGLDSYDNGDLLINGTSTKDYKDRDWDTYRNHTIGFVFQSYNLIPHQSILGNVELALTIAGVNSEDKKIRAKAALEEVGLGDHINKKPNQLSGGQMQRVAIARALVNNPDIILADEPTGALDTSTSIQIMNLLQQVAKKRLVIMVTHNPELANEYSTRIVSVKDGNIVGDTDPYDISSEEDQKPISGELKDIKKSKMNILTSINLSFNNLKTKKARTMLTAFAGSIGIIGIALILSLSNGVDTYINDLQKETMVSYPVVIQKETMDVESIIGLQQDIMRENINNSGDKEEVKDGVYSNNKSLEVSTTLETTNNLRLFKEYLDNKDSEINKYVGANGVNYSYNVNFSVFAYDKEDELVNTNSDTSEILDSNLGFMPPMMMLNNKNNMMSGSASSIGASNFSQLMKGSDEETISPLITDNYEVVEGVWPEKENELVLVLNSNNEISSETLYQLGFITENELKEISDSLKNEEDVSNKYWDFEDIINQKFYMVLESERYIKNDNNTFSYIENDSVEELDLVKEKAMELNIVGIVKPISNEITTSIDSTIGYTSKLTDYVIEKSNDSEIVVAQENDKNINVLSGMDFEASDDDTKISQAKEYLLNMDEDEKVSTYQMIMYLSQDSSEDNTNLSSMSIIGSQPNNSMMASMLDKWVKETPDDTILLKIYDQYIGGYSYEENLQSFGKIDYNNPDSISIYTDSFEDKENMSLSIDEYNNSIDDDDKIVYTDIIASMTESMTSMIDVISYVLIAFVAVSLIVSCIMIGIITHISVIERTKEIGVLRALGASKSNISQVFNAETLIVGLLSGTLGVVMTMLLNIPITSIIQKMLQNTSVTANLPIGSAVSLVVLSVVITIVGGILPAKNAAKKDPVIALRSE